MKELNGVMYFDKRQAIDHIGQCARKKIPIRAVEVVAVEEQDVLTDINKTKWFSSQRGVYKAAKLFVMRQMVGDWKWAEIKTD